DPPVLGFRVFCVVLDPFLEVGASAPRAAHLPKSRDPRFHAETRLAPGRAELILRIRTWTWADDRHVAHDHVPELRQLVEIVLAEDPADARQARIVLDIKLR